MAIYETSYRKSLIYHSIVTNQAHYVAGGVVGTRPPVLCMGLSDKLGVTYGWFGDTPIPLDESLRAKEQRFVWGSQQTWEEARIKQGTLAGPWETGAETEGPPSPYPSNVSTSYINGASSFTISKTWTSDGEYTLYHAAIYTQPRVYNTIFGLDIDRWVVWLHTFDTPMQVFVGDQFTLTFTIIL